MLTSTGLNRVAIGLQSMIASVQINNADIVTDFTSSEVEENVYIFEFDIPAGITRVTNLKLLDGSGVLVGETNLSLPIAVETRFKFKYSANNGGRINA